MAKTIETTAAAAKVREPKPISPKAVRIHDQTGHCYRTFVVDVPDEITLDDIGNKPELWKNVQADRVGKALAEDDRVEMRWLDKQVYAVVDYADSNGVGFMDIRKVSKRDRDRTPFTDGHFEVKWTAGGWAYFRIHDGVRMTAASYPTWEATKAALIREQYPAKVA